MKIAVYFSFFLMIWRCYWCMNVSQVHMAWTGNGISELAFSFVTDDSKSPQKTTILYGTSSSSLNFQQTGYNYAFGTKGHIFMIHNVIVSNLQADTTYYYKVGDSNSNSWSDILSFFTKSNGIRYAVYGDFGISNDRAIDSLVQEVGQLYDAVIHVGDFAYDLDEKNGVTGDEFMNAIQPFASKNVYIDFLKIKNLSNKRVPYMTCPGNHEASGNFSHYQNRFSLVADGVGKTSASGTNLWYSFDMNLVHFIAIDTEVYAYFVDQGQIDRQLNWLEQDLIKANKNRQKVPWIIMYGHKGWFMDKVNYTGFEDLAHKYGVDLYLCGHVHNYQRFFPHHKKKVDKQPTNFYTNPQYMVTIVIGSPGCRELPSHSLGPKSALATSNFNYGFAHLFVANSTHLNWDWEQISTSDNTKTGSIEDNFWIYQSHHGPRI